MGCFSSLKYYLFYLFWQQYEKGHSVYVCRFLWKYRIQSQDMYVKCPKIQSTYFVNCDIYMYIFCIWRVSHSPKNVTYFRPAHFNRFHVFQNTIWILFHYTTSLSTIIELDHNKIFLKFCKIVFFVKSIYLHIFIYMYIHCTKNIWIILQDMKDIMTHPLNTFASIPINL